MSAGMITKYASVDRSRKDTARSGGGALNALEAMTTVGLSLCVTRAWAQSREPLQEWPSSSVATSGSIAERRKVILRRNHNAIHRWR